MLDPRQVDGSINNDVQAYQNLCDFNNYRKQGKWFEIYAPDQPQDVITLFTDQFSDN